MELPSNTLLHNGKYRILQKIGQGGFGIAYRANLVSLNKVICIKEFFFNDLCERSKNSFVMKINSTSQDKIKLVNTFKKKFIKEARRLAEFQHPNIVQVNDVFEENNTAYFVMEYLDGGSLENLIRHNGALNEQKSKELILPIIDALETLHAKGLLHLDIKPANIMLRNNETPVLIDFGISKYLDSVIVKNNTTTTAPIGYSEGYSPIEQSSFGSSVADFTKATDIYSLCATMYKMVTGVTPPEPLQILGKGLKQPKEINPELTETMNNIIVKGMSIRADERFQKSIDLIQLLHPKELEKTTIINIKSYPNFIISNKIDKYEDIGDFSEGLAKVKKDDKWGFINKTGNEVISCKYDNVSDFSDGRAIVTLNNNYGLIGTAGEEILECSYNLIVNDEGFFYVSNHNKEKFIYIKGEGLFSYNYEEFDYPSEGLSRVKLNSNFGFIDKTGNEVITCKYDNASRFSEGLAAVKYNGRYGFIDKTGKIVIPFKYLYAESFRDGHALIQGFKKVFMEVSLEVAFGIIDLKGNEITPCKYSEINYRMSDKRVYTVGVEKGFLNTKLKYGAIDLFGNEIIPLKYDDIDQVYNLLDELSDSITSIKTIDNKIYGFDQNGKTSSLPLFLDDYEIFDGLYVNGKPGEFVIVNRLGKVVVSPKYEGFSRSSEGFALVEFNGKSGFIDKTGQEVIPCQYDSASGFSDGLAKVEYKGEICFIDKQGNIVLK